MKIVDIPIDSIVPAEWNPNEMDPAMLDHLRCSIRRFDLVVPLVVRLMDNLKYEAIGGAQRLCVLEELGLRSVACVIVRANDIEARLLGQSLNHIAGTDNLGLRAIVLREILDGKLTEEVLSLLPETAASLQALTAISAQSIAQAFQQRERSQKARLHHLEFQLTNAQFEVVEEVLQQLLPLIAGADLSPNKRGSALYLLCRGYLERENPHETFVSEESS